MTDIVRDVITNWIALGAGLIGAVSGLGSLIWNVRAWKREGPILRVSARLRHQDDKLLATGLIRNVGRFETTVTDAYFIWSRGLRDVPEEGYRSLGHVVGIPAEHISEINLPQLIKPQTTVRFVVSGIEAINTRIASVVAERSAIRISFRTAAGDMSGADLHPWVDLTADGMDDASWLARRFFTHHAAGEVLAEPAAAPRPAEPRQHAE